MNRTKQDIRRQAIAARRAVAPEASQRASLAVVERVGQSDAWRFAATVLAYWPLPDEVDVRPLVERALSQGKHLALPRCAPGASSFEAVVVTEPAAQLEAGPFPDLMQPLTTLDAVVDPGKIDLAIVPGVAFTPDGVRLGFGAGMYDRFLPQCTRALRLAVAFEAQIVEDIPAEAHDVRMHYVATESRWIEVAGGSPTS